MEWDKHAKPPAHVCPRRYCFHWVPLGGTADMSGRTYHSFEEAIARRDGRTEVPDGGCGCAFGLCTRLDPVNGDQDWYEPFEPALEQVGLPWFYFIPSVDRLAPEFRDEYLRESQAIWGDD
jgi:hypothetical protein